VPILLLPFLLLARMLIVSMAKRKGSGAFGRPLASSDGFSGPTLDCMQDIVAGLIEEAAKRFHFAAHHHLAIFMLSNAGHANYEEASTRLAFVDELGNERDELLFIVLDDQTTSVNEEFHGREAKDCQDRSRQEKNNCMKGAVAPLLTKRNNA
jgi:hypothetical protein